MTNNTKEIDNLNEMKLISKLMKARMCFIEEETTKSGNNTFQNFEYFELKDIVPKITRICNTLQLGTVYKFLNRKATLTIFDLETGAKLQWKIKIEFDKDGNSSKKIQEKGKLMTYTRRYLYLEAFDIVENDIIDAEDQNKEKRSKPKSNKSTNTAGKPLKQNGVYTIWGVQDLIETENPESKKQFVESLFEAKKINKGVYNRCIQLEEGGKL